MCVSFYSIPTRVTSSGVRVECTFCWHWLPASNVVNNLDKYLSPQMSLLSFFLVFSWWYYQNAWCIVFSSVLAVMGLLSVQSAFSDSSLTVSDQDSLSMDTSAKPGVNCTDPLSREGHAADVCQSDRLSVCTLNDCLPWSLLASSTSSMWWCYTGACVRPVCMAWNACLCHSEAGQQKDSLC